MERIYLEQIHRIEEEKRRKFEEEKSRYEQLSAEEKQARLLQGLYNSEWIVEGLDPDEDYFPGHS